MNDPDDLFLDFIITMELIERDLPMSRVDEDKVHRVAKELRHEHMLSPKEAMQLALEKWRISRKEPRWDFHPPRLA